MRRSRSNQYATDKLQPDHICFLAFAFTALLCTVNAYPDVEKIDFVVHKKREVSSSIDDFHAMLKQHLEDIGYPNLSNLVGEIIQGNDDRVPLQAADLACWHIQKYVTRTLDEKDINHFKTIAVERIGYMHQWTDDDIDAFTKPPQAPARSEGMLAIERLIGAGI